MKWPVRNESRTLISFVPIRSFHVRYSISVCSHPSPLYKPAPHNRRLSHYPVRIRQTGHEQVLESLNSLLHRQPAPLTPLEDTTFIYFDR